MSVWDSNFFSSSNNDSWNTSSSAWGTSGWDMSTSAPQPRDGVKTPVTFTLFCDSSQLDEGAKIGLRGDLKVLGEWEKTIPLQQDSENPNLWTVNVALPFKMDEEHRWGLFEFKYVTYEGDGEDTDDSVTYEPYSNRNESKIVSHYFHKFSRSYGYYTTSSSSREEPFVAIVNQFIRQLRDDTITPAGFLHRFFLLEKHGIMDTRKALIEQLFDDRSTFLSEELEDAKNGGGDVDKAVMNEILCMISIIGYYDLPYALKHDVSESNWSGSSYYQTSIDPRPWVWFVCEVAPVSQMRGTDVKKVLGKHYRWCATGTREAVERCFRSGSYAWLRMVPFLELHGIMPKSSTGFKDWNISKNVEEFEIAIESIKELSEQSGDDVLTQSWLKSLVRYCPTIASLYDLFKDFDPNSPFLVRAVCDMVEDYDFGKGELKELRRFMEVHPAIQCEYMGSALLDNYEIDYRTVSRDKLFDLIAFCCENVDEPSEFLIDSVRRWLKRNYVTDPYEAKEKYVTYRTQGGSYYTVKEKEKPKKPTVDKIIKCIEEAAEGWTYVLNIPFFAHQTRPILFEFSRCPFFLNDNLLVFRSILTYSCKKSFSNLHLEVAQHLVDKADSIVVEGLDDYTPYLASITDLLTPKAYTGSEFLYQLVVRVCREGEKANISKETATVAETAADASRATAFEGVDELTPSLTATLENSFLWSSVCDWCNSVSTSGINFTQSTLPQFVSSASNLTNMLVRVCTLLDDHISKLNAATISLEDLHIIRNHQSEFSSLVETAKRYNNRSVTSKCHAFEESVLEKRKEQLSNFDSQMEQVQCYLSLFCQVGEIQSPSLSDTTRQLLQSYNSLTIASLVDAKTEQVNIFDPHIDLRHVQWLYQMRGSELFLTMWKDVTHIPRGGKTPLSILKDKGVETDPRKTCTLCFQEFPSRNALFRHIADAGDHGEGEEPGVAVDLTQEIVSADVIPESQVKWSTLTNRIKSLEMKTSEFMSFFGKSSLSQTREELDLIKTSEKQSETTGWDDGLIRNKVNDFHLVKKLRGWIPSVLCLRAALPSLFSVDPTEDKPLKALEDSNNLLAEQWESFSLATVSDLVEPLRSHFEGFTDLDIDFLQTLGSNTSIAEWLLEKKSTEEFNQLLQVCRPCTDEPRLLSSMASIVHIRTLLSQVLYVKGGGAYADLGGFLSAFKAVEVDSESQWHLSNVDSNFEGLMEVFEKHTRSPGIKACYDLKDVCDSGVMEFRINDIDPNKKLVCCLVGKDSTFVQTFSFDMLVDLRSKLMMTEVPAELVEQTGIDFKSLVTIFIEKFRLLCEVKDVMTTLSSVGHLDFQGEGHRKQYPFSTTTVEQLQTTVHSLNEKVSHWSNSVEKLRRKFTFINSFTVREILLLMKVIQSVGKAPDAEDKSNLQEMMALLRLLRCDATPSDGIAFVQSWMRKTKTADESNTETSSETVFEHIAALGEVLEKFYHDSTSHVRAIAMRDGEGRADRGGRGTHAQADLLMSNLTSSETDLGQNLPVWVTCTESPEEVPNVILSIYARRARLPSPSELLVCTRHTTSEDISLLLRRWIVGKTYESTTKSHKSGEEDQDALFCIANTHILSYTLMCSLIEASRQCISVHGTKKAAGLVLISGKQSQMLSNALAGSQQMEIKSLPKERLRTIVDHVCSAYSASVLAVTSNVNGGGKTQQIQRTVAELQLQAKQHREDLKALGDEGAATAVEDVLYVRVPLRETTNATSLIHALSKPARRHQGCSFAYHLDLGHILPDSVNTLLFQLLFVGVVQDDGIAYHRRKQDHFFVEIPNTPQNRIEEALSFTSLLPSKHIVVSADSLHLTQPVFTNDECTNLSVMDNLDIQFVAKYLRAFDTGKFIFGAAEFDPEFDPFLEAEASREDIWRLLLKYSGQQQHPNFLTLTNFVRLMQQQFQRVMSYSLLDTATLGMLGDGLETFKHTFIDLLIKTSLEFFTASSEGITVDNTQLDENLVQIPEAAEAPVVQHLSRQSSLEVPGALSREASHGGSGGAPSRQSSHGGADAYDQIVKAVSDEIGVGRVASRGYVQRLSALKSWESSDHPLVLFYTTFGMEVSGVDVLCLNPQFVDGYINGDLKNILQANGIQLNRDFRKLKQQEAIEIIQRIEGDLVFGQETDHRVEASGIGYVLTIDNLFKMLSIQLRLKYGLPVVIMGETGSGKTAMISFLCELLGIPLHVFNVHGGIEDGDILAWTCERVEEFEKMRARQPDARVVLFYDEINTCNSMALFKEIVCDRYVNGRQLADGIKIIAACNPYRLRKVKGNKTEAGSSALASSGGGGDGEDLTGLVYEHHISGDVATGITDPLKDLVYRVHPLPESMIDFVFDVGALSADSEALYVEAMIKREIDDPTTEEERAREDRPPEQQMVIGNLNMRRQMANASRNLSKYDEFVLMFSQLMCASQTFIREISDGEKSCVSLRDITRCIKVLKWFYNHFSKMDVLEKGQETEDNYPIQFDSSSQKILRKSVVMALCYCYHGRLNAENRRKYRQRIVQELTRMPQCKSSVKWMSLSTQDQVADMVMDVQKSFVAKMNLGDGIALNEALCENLFMILVSVLNSIPIFVVGKPGTSKSLAMELVQTNLNGEASENKFFQSLPAVESFSYQCSPLSTSAGIEGAFEAARRYRAEATNTVVVVVLDEVGLAEQSPHLPLKVLHRELERLDGIGVVGISNWMLDPAKMNRAVHIYRPNPSVEDLTSTVEGVIGDGRGSANLKGYLRSLAKSYSEVYLSQFRPDFWGLREFYSTVKFINKLMKEKSTEGEGEGVVALTEDILMNAILRNFGGRPGFEHQQVIDTFFQNLGMTTQRATTKMTTVDLIRQNLQQKDARHVMVLTRNNAALELLFELDILNHSNTEVLFGSTFPMDQTDLHICMSIQKIKLCMAQGITVVLVHCDAFYESLYDLLNQHYSEYGGQKYVRLAFGTHSKLCPVHDNFRIVVVVEKSEAWYKLAPPLLNRFEKQVFERSDVLERDDRVVVQRLTAFVQLVVKAFVSDSEEGAEGTTLKDDEISVDTSVPSFVFQARKVFCGYYSGMLNSVALAIRSHKRQSGDANSTIEERVTKGIHTLMSIAFPEAIYILSDPAIQTIYFEYGVNIRDIYFASQSHTDLPSALNLLSVKDFTRVRQTDLDQKKQQEVGQNGEGADPPQSDNIKREGASSSSSSPAAIPSVGGDATDGSVKGEEGAIVEEQPASASGEHSNNVMVVTYSGISSDVKEALAGTVHGRVKSLNLHDLSSCDDLERECREFFKACCEDLNKSKGGDETTADQEGDSREEAHKPIKTAPPSLLIIQSDPLASSMQQIGYSKHLCTKLREEYIGSGNASATQSSVKVVLLIHLTRGMDDSFVFDLVPSWSVVYVDNVLPTEAVGLPDLHQMLGRSLCDMMQEVELEKVLLATFRSSLASLAYPFDRNASQIRDQIACLLEYLRDGAFVRVVEELILEMSMAIPELNDKKWQSQIARASSELSRSGTFRAALHRRLTDTVVSLFTVALAHMERNGGLRLYSQHPVMWQRLFKISFRSLMVVTKAQSLISVNQARNDRGVARSKASSNVDVTSDTPFPFNSKFPFSFYISKTINALRETSAMNGTALMHSSEVTVVEEATQKQFSMMKVGGVSDQLNEELVENYMYDFAAIHLPVTNGLTHDQLFHMLRHLLSLEGNGKISFLTSIHVRYWRIEKILHTFLSLVSSVPSASSEVISHLMGMTSPASDTTIVSVSNIVLRSLLASAERWDSAESYSKWLLEYQIVTPYVESGLKDLFDSAHTTSTSESQTTPHHKSKPKEMDGAYAQVLCLWDAIKLLACWLRHVVVPLQMNTQEAQIMHKALHRAPDVSTNDALYSIILATSKIYSQPHRQTGRYIAAAHRFLESYFFDILFGSSGEDKTWTQGIRLSPQLVVDLCSLVAHKMPSFSGVDKGDQHICEEVIPSSETTRISLLRWLLHLTGPVRDVVTAQVDALLAEGASAANSPFDNMLSMCYVAVTESNESNAEISRQPIATIDVVEIKSRAERLYRNHAAFPSESTKLTAVRAILDDVASMRIAINRCAKEIHRHTAVSKDQSNAGSSRREMLVVENVLSAILDGSTTNVAASSDNAAMTRATSLRSSLRLFLCRCLQRVGGLSFLRSTLQMSLHVQPEKPSPSSEVPIGIGNCEWMKHWRQQDPIVGRFLGTNSLPQYTPYANFPSYQAAVEAITQSLQSASFQPLEGWVASNVVSDSVEHSDAKGALFLAAFNELLLLRTIPKHGVNSEGDKLDSEAVLKWLSTSEVMTNLFKPSESALFGLFNSSRSGSNKTKNYHPFVASLFHVDTSTSLDDVIQLRSLVHIAATSLAAGKDSPAYVLKQIMFDGLSQRSVVKQSLLPSLPGDLRAAMREILQGGWYSCPNGHSYFVDACGRPTEVLKCATCGVDIGGLDHNLLDTNKEVNNKDQSPPGYCLPSCKDEGDKLLSVRDMSAPEVRTWRLMMHGAITLRMCVDANSEGNPSSYDICQKDAWDTLRVQVSAELQKEENTKDKSRLRSLFSRKDNAKATSEKESEAQQHELNRPLVLSSAVVGHWKADWLLLQQLMECNGEDVAAVLHSCLNSMAVTRNPQFQFKSAPPTPVAPAAPLDEDDEDEEDGPPTPPPAPVNTPSTPSEAPSLPMTPEQRKAWEVVLSQSVLQPQLKADGRASRIAGWYDEWSNEKGVTGVFVQQILQSSVARASSTPQTSVAGQVDASPVRLPSNEVDAAHKPVVEEKPAEAEGADGEGDGVVLPLSVRNESLLGLFGYRRDPSLAHMLAVADARMKGQGREADDVSSKWPLISQFLLKENIFSGLQHLNQALQWIRLVSTRFSRKVDRAGARNMTVAQVLAAVDDQPELVRMRWKRAFEGFAACWNSSWEYVDRFGCLRIPQTFKSVKMGLDQPISLSLPNDKDEGICPLSLIHFLAERHNMLVDLCHMSPMASKHHCSAGSHQPLSAPVPTRMFSSSQAFRYDLGTIESFVVGRCVTYSQDGNVSYDLDLLEERLASTLGERPVLDVEVEKVVFIGDKSVVSATSSLKRKLPQSQLPRDIAARIKAEISSPSTAIAVLDLLDTVVSFLEASGATVGSEMEAGTETTLLSDYVHSVLLLPPSSLHSRTLISEVTLGHIEAAMQLLLDATDTDAFANIQSKYRADIEPTDRMEVLESMKHLDLECLIPLLKDYIVSQLSEDFLGADQSMKLCFGYIETNEGTLLMDLPWFEDHFPSSLTLSHSVALFKLLSAPDNS